MRTVPENVMIALRLLILAMLIASTAAGAGVYKWTDAQGRVHYSDQPPPNDAKSIQQKKLGGNFIETDELPYATQVAMKRFDNQCVVVRILDPARADFYSELGLRTISPTKTAIHDLLEAARACEIKPREPIPN